MENLIEECPKETRCVAAREIALENLLILRLENKSDKIVQFPIPPIEDSILFYYQFEGQGALYINNDKIKFENKEQSFFLNTENEKILSLGPQGICVVIQVKNKIVETYLKEMTLRWKNHFYDSKLMTFMCHKHQLPITPPMSECINEMFFSERKGMFLKLILESLILRLFTLQFEQIENHDCEVFCSLKKSEAEKIFKAKKIITSSIKSWFTISELAALVGTNQCTLKKGFKEIYGCAVFEFIKNYKMEKAHQMLYDEEMNISGISEWLGYKNVTHFSAAFKRKFGFRPSNLKTQVLKI
ncbi:helix-turn-helix domain-containing protein [Flavobacterium poyangense]|uniref:helix-turn-helix domain-containing protein n=1 Tax=Flavobacterium poyangense TaxID=2204302 RepID=UPI0014243CCC|nr:AraC family transcriptional regulator [Flavobacterium sp. JXAS1]